MFDFLDSDWFNITLNIIFILLISWDIKQYINTKKKEYITNIILTLLFGIWALYPYYISYFQWNTQEKDHLLAQCKNDTNATLCYCINEAIFKEYSFKEFQQLDKNSSTYQEFLKTTTKQCKGEDDGWFF